MPMAPLTRIRTGIPGLDNIMDGGFIENTITVLSGPAGSGKSLLAMQYLFNGARNFNEPGIYITVTRFLSPATPRSVPSRAMRGENGFSLDYSRAEARWQ